MKSIRRVSKSLPAPVRIVRDNLIAPESGSRAWLSLGSDETQPRVLAASDESVVWSSLWLNRPNDEIRFELAAKNSECLLAWELFVDAPEPEDSEAQAMASRVNKIVNNDLRRSFGA
jgi:hypothetical protein